MNNSLENLLSDALANGKTEESFLVKQLRRQIAAKQSGQTSQDLYVTGSYKQSTNTS
jgi:hypothetical protein